MTQFTVDKSDMAKGKGYVQESSAKVKGYLNSLERDVEELLPGWQSTGSRAFASAHRSWTEKATTINNALDDLGEKLGIVGVTTGQGDDSVTTSFAKFGS
jgi:WXG100 family type VII secretion target